MPCVHEGLHINLLSALRRDANVTLFAWLRRQADLVDMPFWSAEDRASWDRKNAHSGDHEGISRALAGLPLHFFDGGHATGCYERHATSCALLDSSGLRLGLQQRSGIVAQHLLWASCLQAITHYEVAHNTTFDAILKVRPDLLWHEHPVALKWPDMARKAIFQERPYAGRAAQANALADWVFAVPHSIAFDIMGRWWDDYCSACQQLGTHALRMQEPSSEYVLKSIAMRASMRSGVNYSVAPLPALLIRPASESASQNRWCGKMGTYDVCKSLRSRCFGMTGIDEAAVTGESRGPKHGG